MIGVIQSLLLPQSCASCGLECSGDLALCRLCASKLTLIQAPICSRCGRQLPPTEDAHAVCCDCRENSYAYDRMRSAYEYTGICKSLLLAYKFQHRWRLGRYLAEQCAPLLPDFPLTEIDFCLSVPTPFYRSMTRAYNPCRFLTSTVTKMIARPHAENILSWTKFRPAQHSLDREKRRTLSSGHFRTMRPVRDKTLLLVDDIYTTGATVQACSQALKQAGAKAVFVLTIARTPLSTGDS